MPTLPHSLDYVCQQLPLLRHLAAGRINCSQSRQCAQRVRDNHSLRRSRRNIQGYDAYTPASSTAESHPQQTAAQQSHCQHAQPTRSCNITATGSLVLNPPW
eukprot:GHRQ01037203.1.p2 GENE.GHRQ01037203.1~~GHRQ01037203.1.p2  ORF type:complete len:102 (+),score=10.01 GHRQ01037203.1:27-332(+)